MRLLTQQLKDSWQEVEYFYLLPAVAIGYMTGTQQDPNILLQTLAQTCDICLEDTIINGRLPLVVLCCLVSEYK